MAKKKETTSSATFLRKPKRKKKGVVSKNKNGRNKGSKNYAKKYRGQGRAR